MLTPYDLMVAPLPARSESQYFGSKPIPICNLTPFSSSQQPTAISRLLALYRRYHSARVLSRPKLKVPNSLPRPRRQPPVFDRNRHTRADECRFDVRLSPYLPVSDRSCYQTSRSCANRRDNRAPGVSDSPAYRRSLPRRDGTVLPPSCPRARSARARRACPRALRCPSSR